mgnify:FL=1
MNLCSDGHEEVCFEGRICPVCSLREDLEKRIDELIKLMSLLTDLKRI